MDSPDLQVKYQKLAGEYTKFRAQNQVLKKAVIEEQSKNLELKENLKSRDQSLRKAEQELDSLSFRNQQLTKRLSVLQDDLEVLQRKKAPKGLYNQDGFHMVSAIEGNVYAEELQSRIEENAHLHAQMAEKEALYTARLTDLEEKCKHTQKSAHANIEDRKSERESLQKEICKLEDEKVLFEVASQQRSTELSKLRSQIEKLKLHCKCTAYNYATNEYLIPVESFPRLDPPKDLSINSINSDSPEMSEKVGGRILKEMSSDVSVLCTSFKRFLQCFSSLIKQISSPGISQLKLVDKLEQESSIWDSLSAAFMEFTKALKEGGSIQLKNLSGMEGVSRAVVNCASSLRKILPVLSDKWEFSKQQLDAPWRSSVGRFVSCWASLTPYLTSLTAHNDRRTVLSQISIGKILGLLGDRLSKLHSTSHELVAAWEIVMNQESGEEKLVLDSLNSIFEAIGKISSLFSTKIIHGCNFAESTPSTPSSVSSRTPPNSIHPVLSLIASPVQENMVWSGSSPEGVPTMPDSDASLAQQLAQATSRLSKLEEEREHWRLEHQLLSHRFEKENKKLQELEERLRLLDRISKVDGCKNTLVPSQEINSKPIEVGRNDGSTSLEEREKEIRNHFTTRCSHLYMQLTASTSQAAFYQNECETIVRRLALSEELRGSMEQEVEDQRKIVSQLNETLATTSRNYEEQIQTMSDHLAGLNEKISIQADTIEHLKFENKNKKWRK